MSSSEANAAQVEHWNSEAALHWVTDRDGHDRMLAPFATALLEAAALTPDDRVLDIGCGTGPTTCEAARIASRGHVRGLDISQPLIEAARSRAAELGITNVSFDVGDAQTDSFAPEFDVVMSRFGVMFFDDPAAAFANLRTALDPSGRLVFVCWQDLFVNEWMAVPGLAAAQHVPLPEPGPPDAPGPFSLGDADRLRELLELRGLLRDHDRSVRDLDPARRGRLARGSGDLPAVDRDGARPVRGRAGRRGRTGDRGREVRDGGARHPRWRAAGRGDLARVRDRLTHGTRDTDRGQVWVMTLRMTSPACMARKASFTSSSPISALTMSAMSRRPDSTRPTKRGKSRRTCADP